MTQMASRHGCNAERDASGVAPAAGCLRRFLGSADGADSRGDEGPPALGYAQRSAARATAASRVRLKSPGVWPALSMPRWLSLLVAYGRRGPTLRCPRTTCGANLPNPRNLRIVNGALRLPLDQNRRSSADGP